MKLKHAPGPYKAIEGKQGWQIHSLSKSTEECSQWLANIKCESCPDYEEGTAALFASAPELLEALRQMVANAEADRKEYRDCYKKAVAAIAKAEDRA